jgi:hypothetical protein
LFFVLAQKQLNKVIELFVCNSGGKKIPVWARFFALVQTGREAQPASCTMSTGSFPGVESGRDVVLSPHPLLVPRSKTIPLLSLRAFVACKKDETYLSKRHISREVQT